MRNPGVRAKCNSVNKQETVGQLKGSDDGDASHVAVIPVRRTVGSVYSIKLSH